MVPGLSRNRKPIGIFTLNSGTACGFVVLNSKLSLNIKLSAVVPKNEPPRRSKLAFRPKKIPFGLSKNRFALPKTPSFPRIFEGLPPVTLVRILVMLAGLEK